MKRILSALILSAAFLAPTGCKTASTTTPPAALAPGALNTFDQQAYQTLAAAHAFVATASAKASTLTPAQTQALNMMIQAVNVAQTVYIAYHSGTETQGNVQNELNSVSTAQTTYANSVVAGAK